MAFTVTTHFRPTSTGSATVVAPRPGRLVSSKSLLAGSPPAAGGMLATRRPNAPFALSCVSERQIQVLLCAACSLLNYADRVNMSVTIIAMSADFKWNHDKQAAIMSAFFCGYLPMQIGGALLCRRYGGKAVLTYGAVLWSAFTALTPLAAGLGFWVLIACRVAMGLSEGVAFPSMFHYLASWVPEAERGRSVSTFLIGVYLGTTIALVVSPKIIAWHSWQMVFYSFGLAGGVWVLFWVFLARDRDTTSNEATANNVELSELASQDDMSLSRLSSNSSLDLDDPQLSSTEVQRVALLPAEISAALEPSRYHRGLLERIISPAEAKAFRFIITSKPCLALCCIQFCVSFSHYAILSWLPTYYHRVFDVETATLWFTCVPYLSMAIAANFGGWGADRLIAGGMSLTRSRMLMTSLALTGASVFLVLFSLSGSLLWSVALIALSLAFMSLATGGFEATYLDVASPKLVGSLKGLSNTLGALSGVLAMPYTSVVLRVTDGSWRAVFASLAVFFCIGMAVFAGYGTSERVLVEDGESSDSVLTGIEGEHDI